MTQKKRILIVDDERDYVDTLKERLEFEGYEVECACDGLSGLDAFARFRPSVLLLDIMMPGIDGFEFVRKLTAQGLRENILIIFVTAYGRKHTEEEALIIGDSLVLKKPFEMIELIDLIEGKSLY